MNLMNSSDLVNKVDDKMLNDHLTVETICIRKRMIIASIICFICLAGLIVNLQREEDTPITTLPEPLGPQVMMQSTSAIQADLKPEYISSSSSDYHDYHQPAHEGDEMFANHAPFLHHSVDTVTSFDVTCAATTVVKLVSHADYETIHVGDTLHFTIKAKNSYGAPRTIGGDFWLGALQSPHLTAGTTAKIIDHDNGTYSMYLIAGWKGDAMLQLTLAHPSEGVHWLKTVYKYGDHLPMWDGEFQLGTTKETSRCYLMYDSTWNNMCEYQPKKALKHTKFVCDKPVTLPCESLAGIRGASNFAGEFARLLPIEKKVLFSGEHLYRKVPITHGFINIKESTNKSTIHKGTLHLPPCGADLHVPLSDGYWHNGQWYSLVCDAIQTYSKTSAVQCLQHTNVVFTGDSTTRQWFASLAQLLDVGHPEDHERTFFLERTIAKSDINISFVFHPLSTHPKPVFVNMSQVRFEVDILLDLPRYTCNHVVVVSPWAHFIMWPWDAYVEWLTHIRDAMLQVQKRCPHLKVIIKSPHAVNKVTTMKGRDFMFIEMMHAMRDVFQGSGAMFIDIWDMDYAYPSPMELHMPKEVINQEIALFLSYLCPDNPQVPPTYEEQVQSFKNIKVA